MQIVRQKGIQATYDSIRMAAQCQQNHGDRTQSRDYQAGRGGGLTTEEQTELWGSDRNVIYPRQDVVVEIFLNFRSEKNMFKKRI